MWPMRVERAVEEIEAAGLEAMQEACDGTWAVCCAIRRELGGTKSMVPGLERV